MTKVSAGLPATGWLAGWLAAANDPAALVTGVSEQVEPLIDFLQTTP
jgi:hypothetical protein